MSSNHLRRVLALEVRSRAFAYVLVEGPHELLDWSVRSFRGGVNAVRVPAGKKIADLLSEYCPDVVLVRVAKDAHGKPVTCDVTDALRKSGHRAVRFVDPQAVRRFFARSDQARNKYEIAAIVARRFPEILWKLPRIRKAWESEDYRIALFDAAALALTYFPRSRDDAAREAQASV